MGLPKRPTPTVDRYGNPRRRRGRYLDPYLEVERIAKQFDQPLPDDWRDRVEVQWQGAPGNSRLDVEARPPDPEDVAAEQERQRQVEAAQKAQEAALRAQARLLEEQAKGTKRAAAQRNILSRRDVARERGRRRAQLAGRRLLLSSESRGLLGGAGSLGE